MKFQQPMSTCQWPTSDAVLPRCQKRTREMLTLTSRGEFYGLWGIYIYNVYIYTHITLYNYIYIYTLNGFISNSAAVFLRPGVLLLVSSHNHLDFLSSWQAGTSNIPCWKICIDPFNCSMIFTLTTSHWGVQLLWTAGGYSFQFWSSSLQISWQISPMAGL